MNGVPIGGIAIDRGVLAHRADHDPVGQRNGAQGKWSEELAGHKLVKVNFRRGKRVYIRPAASEFSTFIQPDGHVAFVIMRHITIYL